MIRALVTVALETIHYCWMVQTATRGRIYRNINPDTNFFRQTLPITDLGKWSYYILDSQDFYFFNIRFGYSAWGIRATVSCCLWSHLEDSLYLSFSAPEHFSCAAQSTILAWWLCAGINWLLYMHNRNITPLWPYNQRPVNQKKPGQRTVPLRDLVDVRLLVGR